MRNAREQEEINRDNRSVKKQPKTRNNYLPVTNIRYHIDSIFSSNFYLYSDHIRIILGN